MICHTLVLQQLPSTEVTGGTTLWVLLWLLLLQFLVSAGSKLHTPSPSAVCAAGAHPSPPEHRHQWAAHRPGGPKASCFIRIQPSNKESRLHKWPSKICYFSQRKAVSEHRQADSTFLPAGRQPMPALRNMYVPRIYFELMFYAFGNWCFLVYVYINYCSCFYPICALRWSELILINSRSLAAPMDACATMDQGQARDTVVSDLYCTPLRRFTAVNISALPFCGKATDCHIHSGWLHLNWKNAFSIPELQQKPLFL